MRLLIADDDQAVRIALRMVLEAAGHEVIGAASDAEARVALGQNRLDFALVDAGMSGRGVELWRHMTESAPGPGRVLLLTGDLQALGQLADGSAVLGKPFDFDRLLSRIQALGPRS